MNWKKKWLNEVTFYSDTDKILSNDYYINILGLGKEVVKYIIEDLKENNVNWFHALNYLIEENPVKKEHTGFFGKMKKDWIDWLANNKEESLYTII